MAGKKEEIFTESAYQLIFEESKGIPRKINNICDISLMLGYSKKLDKICEDVIRPITDDMREYKDLEVMTNHTGKI